MLNVIGYRINKKSICCTKMCSNEIASSSQGLHNNFSHFEYCWMLVFDTVFELLEEYHVFWLLDRKFASAE